MDNTIAEILKNMKHERKRIAIDLKRLDNAILALSSQETPTKQVTPSKTIRKRKSKMVKVKSGFTGRTKEMRESSVKWSFEVNRVFETKNNLLPGAVVEELKNNGVPGLDDTSTKKRVYATLNRKVKTGDLFQNEVGEYYKK